MIKLKKATIYKYKCIENEQTFEVEPDITVLVGMNESGKTSLLEALAKVNYFDNSDSDYQFDMTHDYPRKQRKAAGKSGEDINAVKLCYEIDDALKETIEKDILIESIQNSFSYTRKYNNSSSVDMQNFNTSDFVIAKLRDLNITDEKYNKLFSTEKSLINPETP